MHIVHAWVHCMCAWPHTLARCVHAHWHARILPCTLLCTLMLSVADPLLLCCCCAVRSAAVTCCCCLSSLPSSHVLLSRTSSHG